MICVILTLFDYRTIIIAKEVQVMEKKVKVVISKALDRLPLVVCEVWLDDVKLGEFKMRHVYENAKKYLSLLKEGFELVDEVSGGGENGNAK